MRELSAALTLFSSLKFFEDAVVATIISTEGSTYRKAGTRGLFLNDGRSAGILSGGCLENEIKQIALKVSKKNAAEIHSFDSRSSDDILLGFGLGCNGKVDVLFEPLSTQNSLNAFKLTLDQYSSIKKETHTYNISVFLETYANTFQRLNTYTCNSAPYDFHTFNQQFNVFLDRQLIALIESKKTTWSSFTDSQNKKYAVFAEIPQHQKELTIFGAGTDAFSLAENASLQGWKIHIWDHRSSAIELFSTFKNAHTHLMPRDLKIHNLASSYSDAVIIMTHNFLMDLEIVKALSGKKIPYLGLLGPKIRGDSLIQQAQMCGCDTSQFQIFSPVGLDIGGSGPDEIAVSIVSGIISQSSQQKKSYSAWGV